MDTKTEGPLATGCHWLYAKEFVSFQLIEHDLAMLHRFETLDREAMEAMAVIPRFAIYKPVMEIMARRKFPPRDEETDLDWRLDRAKRQVSRTENRLPRRGKPGRPLRRFTLRPSRRSAR